MDNVQWDVLCTGRCECCEEERRDETMEPVVVLVTKGLSTGKQTNVRDNWHHTSPQDKRKRRQTISCHPKWLQPSDVRQKSMNWNGNSKHKRPSCRAWTWTLGSYIYIYIDTRSTAGGGGISQDNEFVGEDGWLSFIDCKAIQ